MILSLNRGKATDIILVGADGVYPVDGVVDEEGARRAPLQKKTTALQRKLQSG